MYRESFLDRRGTINPMNLDTEIKLNRLADVVGLAVLFLVLLTTILAIIIIPVRNMGWVGLLVPLGLFSTMGLVWFVFEFSSLGDRSYYRNSRRKW